MRSHAGGEERVPSDESVRENKKKFYRDRISEMEKNVNEYVLSVVKSFIQGKECVGVGSAVNRAGPGKVRKYFQLAFCRASAPPA